MSAATPPNAPRRPAAQPRPAPAATARPAPRAAAATWFDDEPEFRLDLSDIPKTRGSMHVEGLKPTLLSRLLDLVAPIRA